MHRLVALMNHMIHVARFIFKWQCMKHRGYKLVGVYNGFKLVSFMHGNTLLYLHSRLAAFYCQLCLRCCWSSGFLGN